MAFGNKSWLNCWSSCCFGWYIVRPCDLISFEFSPGLLRVSEFRFQRLNKSGSQPIISLCSIKYARYRHNWWSRMRKEVGFSVNVENYEMIMSPSLKRSQALISKFETYRLISSNYRMFAEMLIELICDPGYAPLPSRLLPSASALLAFPLTSDGTGKGFCIENLVDKVESNSKCNLM